MVPKDILYSFRRCPYAIRARWSIIQSGLYVVIREVDLKSKPTQLITISSKATVPVLKTYEGKIIDESIEIMKWAINNSSKLKEFSINTMTNLDEIISLVNQNDNSFKYHLDRFKYNSRYLNEKKSYHKTEARKILLDWNNRILKSQKDTRNGWLVSNSETMADWALWPFVRQYLNSDLNFLEEYKELKSLNKWLHFYLEHSLYQSLMNKYTPWRETDETIIFPS